MTLFNLLFVLKNGENGNSTRGAVAVFHITKRENLFCVINNRYAVRNFGFAGYFFPIALAAAVVNGLQIAATTEGIRADLGHAVPGSYSLANKW